MSTDLERVEKDVARAEEPAQMAEAKAEREIAQLMAIRFPRNPEAQHAAVLKMLDRPAFAEGAYYSYPRGGTDVSGPSAPLARSVAAIWKNLRYGLRIPYHDGKRVVIEGFALDLETNTLITLQDSFALSTQRKNAQTGVTTYTDINGDEREVRMTVNRRGAILVRNCLLQLFPPDYVDEWMLKARGKVKDGNGLSIDQRRKRLLAPFEKLGVYPPMLEWYCQQHFGHGFDEIDGDEIAELAGVGTAIRGGAAKREEYFKPTKPKPAEEENQAFNLGDLDESEVVDEPDPEPTKKYPSTADMRRDVVRSIIDRKGNAEGVVESHLKIKYGGVTEITDLKGDMLKKAYDQEVRAHETP